MINDNLNGTFYVSRAVWPHMVESGGGAIVNMSSLAAQRGFSPKMKEQFGTTAPSYYVAKAGIDALTRYMAGVGGDKNIRVNCIAPTLTNSKMSQNILKSKLMAEGIAKSHPMKRVGKPEDVANAVVFLASSLSDYINGETLHVNGGMYMS